MNAKDVIKMFAEAKFKGRHGDVVIVRAPTCPTEGAPTTVLAEGEVTGHAHRLDRGKAMRVAGSVAQRLVKIAVGAVAKVDHEEHTAQRLPPGTYRTGIQAQWTPEGLRRVVD